MVKIEESAKSNGVQDQLYKTTSLRTKEALPTIRSIADNATATKNAMQNLKRAAVADKYPKFQQHFEKMLRQAQIEAIEDETGVEINQNSVTSGFGDGAGGQHLQSLMRQL